MEDGMIRNEAEYQEASTRLAEARTRLAEHRARLKEAGLKNDEIKRVIDRDGVVPSPTARRGRELRTAEAW